MLNSIFESVISSSKLTPITFFICTIASLVLGFLIASLFMLKCNATKNFIVTLALIPVMVQAIIMLVNGNLGTGVAVAGAFSLVRFRSLPGSSKEISAVFFAMATGLATGVGYIGIATMFVVIILAFNALYTFIDFKIVNTSEQELKITIPESLDYNGLFDDILNKYTKSFNLSRVRTTNMGSLYQLFYIIQIKDVAEEKSMIDEIRCRNGNLDIVCGRVTSAKDPL